MGWLKIQKLEYLENKTEFFSEIRSYRFVAEVTFKVNVIVRGGENARIKLDDFTSSKKEKLLDINFFDKLKF